MRMKISITVVESDGQYNDDVDYDENRILTIITRTLTIFIIIIITIIMAINDHETTISANDTINHTFSPSHPSL